MKKKMMALLLTLAMVVTYMPVATAFAAPAPAPEPEKQTTAFTVHCYDDTQLIGTERLAIENTGKWEKSVEDAIKTALEGNKKYKEVKDFNTDPSFGNETKCKNNDTIGTSLTIYVHAKLVEYVDVNVYRSDALLRPVATVQLEKGTKIGKKEKDSILETLNAADAHLKKDTKLYTDSNCESEANNIDVVDGLKLYFSKDDVLKAPEYTAPQGKTIVCDGEMHELIVKGSDNVKYSLEEKGPYKEYKSAELSAKEVGTYVVYYQVEGKEADGEYTVEGLVTSYIAVDVNAPQAVAGLVYNGMPQQLIVAGTTSIGTMEYKLSSESTYSTAVPTAINAGEYTIDYKVENAPTLVQGSISVSIAKADPEYVAPTVIAAQRYTGTALDLIVKGSTEHGTITYKVGDGEYGDEAQALEVGEYNVYFKLVGDSNHNDVEETLIGTASIVEKPVITAELSTTSYTYNGTTKTPAVVVKDENGNEVAQSNYEVSGDTSAKLPGTYTIKVTGINEFAGEVECSYKISVKKASFKSLKKGSKSFTVQVKKLSKTYVTGYQVRHSLKSNMSNAKRITIGKKYSTVKKTVKNLKKGKKYYVQVRSYKTINGKKYYSAWSASKTVKTK